LNILITICARGGSKGIPGKNIKMLNNKPLIAYTIQTAKKFQLLYNADIVISSDDEEIRQTARNQGLKTPYERPKHLAQDTTGKIETILDVLIFQESLMEKEYDYILDLDVTSPLRTMNDLENAFKMLQSDENAYNLFSVNNANRNPYFNIVEKKENGYYNIVKEGHFLSRQTAPKVYDMNSSFYFYKRIFFRLDLKKTTTEKSMVYLMPHTCFDLDHPIDFEFMEFLMSTNKLGFNL